MIHRFADRRFELLDAAAGERQYLESHIPGAGNFHHADPAPIPAAPGLPPA